MSAAIGCVTTTEKGMIMMTIKYADKEGDVNVFIQAPTERDDDAEAILRKERMQARLEQAIAWLGERYLLHPSKRVQRAGPKLEFSR